MTEVTQPLTVVKQVNKLNGTLNEVFTKWSDGHITHRTERPDDLHEYPPLETELKPKEIKDLKINWGQ